MGKEKCTKLYSSTFSDILGGMGGGGGGGGDNYRPGNFYQVIFGNLMSWVVVCGAGGWTRRAS